MAHVFPGLNVRKDGRSSFNIGNVYRPVKGEAVLVVDFAQDIAIHVIGVHSEADGLSIDKSIYLR